MSTSRAGFTDDNASPAQNNSGAYQGQCTPMPLPTLGTQKIIQGNGTSVGTVISLQCPAKHRLVGRDLMCVMISNSTQWVGQTYCKPLSPFQDLGFRVAVLGSIVSSAIILLLSVAFVTCCVQDCIKKDRRRRKIESDADLWPSLEQTGRMEGRSHRSHRGRNSNNNNSANPERALCLWIDPDPPLSSSKTSCRYCERHPCGPAVPPSAGGYGSVPLPGCIYNQPLLHQNSRLDLNSGKLLNSVSRQSMAAPQHPGPPSLSRQAQVPGLVQRGAEGPSISSVWQYAGQQEVSVSTLSLTVTQEPYRMDTHSAQERSVQIRSV